MGICKNTTCKKEFEVPDWALDPVYAEYCQKCINLALKKNLSSGETVEDGIKKEINKSFGTPKTKEISKTVFSFSYNTADGKPRTELFPTVEKMYSKVHDSGDIVNEHFLSIGTLNAFRSQMQFQDRWRAEIIGISQFGWVEFEKHKIVFEEPKRLKK